jgi:sarcosine oxidase subunit beta
MSQTADVVVIGGGIMGTATAYNLAKGGGDVLLLEKTFLGAGSTGRTGGIIRQHYSLEVTARMAYRALKNYWGDFDQTVGGEVGFVRTGVAFISSADEKPNMEASAKMHQSIGIRTEVLGADALREVAPYLHSDDVGCATYEPDGGYADGSMACNAFATRTRELGGTVKQGVEVTGIRLEGGRVVGVDTNEGPIDTPVVVNTAGPWGTYIAKMVGVEVPAEVSRHQIATFAQPKDFHTPVHLVIGDFVNGHYMRPETGGLTLAGSLEDDTSDVVDPDSYNTEVDRPFVEVMVDRSAKRMPDLERGGVQGGWSGLYSVMTDWNPVIDSIEDVPGFVVGFGGSGHCFKLGPVIGEMLADLATGQNDCPIDPAPFSLSRFSEGKELRSEYGFSIVG